MQRPIIVCLTTISSRVKTIDSVISAMFTQTCPPQTVLLSISDHPYLLDHGVELTDLPKSVKKWAVNGDVQIAFVKNDGPYRKLLPALRRFRHLDCLIVTADDDTIYPSKWLAGLVAGYERHQCVAAYRTRLAGRRNGSLEPYAKWPLVAENRQDHAQYYANPHMPIFPTGRGGVLYHPSFFPDLSLLQKFMQLAPAQDDVAFRVATCLAGVPVITVPLSMAGSSGRDFGGPAISDELWKHNLAITGGASDNDRALAAVADYCTCQGLNLDRMWP